MQDLSDFKNFPNPSFFDRVSLTTASFFLFHPARNVGRSRHRVLIRRRCGVSASEQFRNRLRIGPISPAFREWIRRDAHAKKLAGEAFSMLVRF